MRCVCLSYILILPQKFLIERNFVPASDVLRALGLIIEVRTFTILCLTALDSIGCNLWEKVSMEWTSDSRD